MQFPDRPKLRFLHSAVALNPAKLEALHRLSTGAIKTSLDPAQPGSLKARTDGTVLDGHHRLSILLERGEHIDELPRKILEKETHES